MAKQSHLDFFSDVRIDPQSSTPKHRQVYEALRDVIVEGKLNADDELPSTRELARELGVARNTVITAYELLLAEGYATSRGGAGTFVAGDAARPAQAVARPRAEPRSLSSLADMLRVGGLPILRASARPFGPSSPAVDAFPYATWSRIVARVLRGSDRVWMTEGHPLGHPGLRKAIARHLHAFRSTPCDPDQILIISGAQLGLFLCSMLLLDPNDAVWIEEPGYRRARLTFRARSDRVIPVPLDDSGINIEAGRALSPDPRVIFVTPTHQWPLGSTMSIHRRLALLEFAAERGAWIIEDDYDGDLRFARNTYAALRGLDEADRVIHIGTFTKTLTPGVRIAYLVLPVDLVDAFVAGRTILDRYANPIAQAALGEFIECGAYARHVYEMQRLYLERHQLLRARINSKLVGFLEAKVSPGGTFTETELATGIDDVALAVALEHEGFDSLPLSTTYAGPPGKRGLLLGHAVAKPEDIRRGVDALERIATSWSSFTRSRRSVPTRSAQSRRA